MQIDIITIFPNQVESFFKEGIFRIASENGVEFKVHDLRNWTNDRHKTVDDKPFGGGAGMLMKIEPIYKALKEIKKKNSYVILTGASGNILNANKAKKFSKKEHLIIICGHYEGVDYRVKKHLVDEEVSIGKYVLSGGELPALVITDTVLRFIPGVLGNSDSLSEESFEGSINKEYPQYTRPENFMGWVVPKVLLSGDHKKVKIWRENRSQSKHVDIQL
ncbi:tRNA (guanosine(37)-N1)-methyltransferase TrmD [Candidatus Dojkabacteria bacterium]|nr:tRNA (guanosine(37)-N1)-methyltransferase TrmD [Candidatus Dojkabacteria bacterium]